MVDGLLGLCRQKEYQLLYMDLLSENNPDALQKILQRIVGKMLPPSMQFYMKGNLICEADEDEEKSRKIRTAFNQKFVKQILKEYTHI